MEMKFNVIGMKCMHCVSSVKTAVVALNGVSSVNIADDMKTVTVEFDAPCTAEDIKSAIEDTGFDVE
ncbi:MAG: heavy-metal-associated domain-containing protein [Clostridia bacterium]|nr:heavy-metal-associated domain-containing protein [Clostridia bacterium]